MDDKNKVAKSFQANSSLKGRQVFVMLAQVEKGYVMFAFPNAEVSNAQLKSKSPVVKLKEE